MTETASSGTNRLAAVRRYRRLFYASILIGTAGLLVATYVDYPLVGIGIYWAGVVAAIAILRGTSVELYDERDVDLERRASLRALYLIGGAAVLGFPAAVAAEELGYWTLPAELAGAMYGYVVLWAVWGVSYLWLRYRPSR